MARKHAPTFIDVNHAQTAAAEFRRERARPVTLREPETAAAWEDTSEPTPPPAARPQLGRTKTTKIIVESRPKGYKPGEVPDDDTITAVIDTLFPGGLK